MCFDKGKNMLKDQHAHFIERQKLVSLVRVNSQAPKYNKISKRTDEILYVLVGQEIRR